MARPFVFFDLDSTAFDVLSIASYIKLPANRNLHLVSRFANHHSSFYNAAKLFLKQLPEPGWKFHFLEIIHIQADGHIMTDDSWVVFAFLKTRYPKVMEVRPSLRIRTSTSILSP